MPLTPEHNIYYPDSQSQFTPLESHFAALATSVDDAMIAQGSDLQSILEAAIRNAVPTGTISAFGGTSAPPGYLLCDNQLVQISAHPELFDVIGNRYGGNGTNNFRTPDLRGRVPAGLHTGQTDFNALGKTGGAATHTLTVAQMPAHNHRAGGGGSARFMTTTRAGSFSNRTAPTGTSGSAYVPAYGSTQSVDGVFTSADTGSGQAHNNLQPYLTVNYIIKT